MRYLEIELKKHLSNVGLSSAPLKSFTFRSARHLRDSGVALSFFH